MTTTEDPPKRPFWRLTGVPTWAVTVLAGVALILAAVAFVAVVATGKGAQDQAATVAQDTAPAVLTLDVLCKRSDQLGADLRNAGACGEKIDKAKSAVDGQPQPDVAAAGLSRDDVTAIVAGQLAGKTVTVDQVTALVTQVYNANKPKDAPPPTSEQVLAAVTAVCGTTECRGPAGADGKDAPPATDAQILAQVSAFCSGEGAPCRGPVGPQGEAGPQGVSIVGQAFVRNAQGECRNQVTLSDQRVLDGGPAGDAACPAAPLLGG